MRGDVVQAVPIEFMLHSEGGNNFLGEDASFMLEDAPFSFLPALTTQPLTSELARRADGVADKLSHVRVATASEGSAIRVGDLMVEVNGKK